ncbi:MAG: hypothetical protein ACM30E_01600 [Nitrososphaerales archaeon]
MKNFISAADIEALADQGVHELTVDEDTVLTAVARETAAQLGVRLVAPGAARSSGPDTGRGPGGAAPAPTVSGKPRGCQHGPISAGAASPRPASTGASPVVDELIGAVKQMARK